MKYGLLGRQLSHSYSPAIHEALGSFPYDLIEVEPEALEAFFADFHYSGINVTIPYKTAVIPYLQRFTPVAQKIGAVNTVVPTADGGLLGHNTDYFGFQYMLKQGDLEISGKKALVLGSGGAGKVCKLVLEELGAQVITICRSGKHNYNNLHLHRDAAILVNATSVGMYPNCGHSPVELEVFPQLEAVLDVVYNPARTELLMEAEARGLKTVNGLWMLVAQAWEASRFFNCTKLSENAIPQIYKRIQSKTQNIILIGMPGCGKTTIGKMLAEALHRPFVDTDAAIESKFGVSCENILKTQGNTRFRDLETDVIKELSQSSGLVIATGGGVVTQNRNYPLLHQNGILIHLLRPASLLETQGRPLSVNVEALWEERKNLYEAFRDHAVENCGRPEDALSNILNILEVAE